MDSAEALGRFRSTYPVRGLDLSKIESEFQIAAVSVEILRQAPNNDAVTAIGPVSRAAANDGRHLWVIDDRGLPYILEVPMPECGWGPPKHSNVTAGRPACIGGELWFVDPESLYVSGGSGRYPLRTAEHLEDAVNIFRAFGYSAVSLGWDDGIGKPRRYLE